MKKTGETGIVFGGRAIDARRWLAVFIPAAFMLDAKARMTALA
jgi:hypothetical protein